MEKLPALTDNESDMNTDNKTVDSVFQFKTPITANFVKPKLIKKLKIGDKISPTKQDRLPDVINDLSTMQVVPTYQPDAENSVSPSDKEAGIKDITSYQQKYR